MDGFELNKIAGSVLGTLLATMGLGIVAEAIFHTATPEKQGFVIATAEEPAAATTAPEQAASAGAAPIATRLASADAAKGAAAGKPCLACHSFEKGGPAKTGPNLWEIVGRAPGSVEGFAYSEAMKAKVGEPWSYETLDRFVADPKGYLPGTKMVFGGIKKETARADLVAYLGTLSDNPVPLPAAPATGQGAAPAGQEPGASTAPATSSSTTEAQPGATPEGETQAQ